MTCARQYQAAARLHQQRHDGRADKDRRQFQQAGNGQRGGANPHPSHRRGAAEFGKPDQRQHGEEHHRRIRYDNPAEEHARGRHGDEERRAVGNRSPAVENHREAICRPDECQGKRDDHEPPDGLVQASDFIEERDKRRDQRALGLHIAVAPSPIDLRIERNEGPFIEVARHGGRIELPPCVRINERSGEMEEPKRGAERQDQQKGGSVAAH
jgi:hypothetical protein